MNSLTYYKTIGRSFIEHYYSELNHSGTEGMKWGYTLGKRNGKRVAKGPDDDLRNMIEKVQLGNNKQLPNEIMERSESISPYEIGEQEAIKNFKPKIPGWRPPALTRKWTKEEDQAVVNQVQDFYNCALCSYAYDLRRRGYDVVARPFCPDYPGLLPFVTPISKDDWSFQFRDQLLLAYDGATRIAFDGSVVVGSDDKYRGMKNIRYIPPEKLRLYADKWIKDMINIGDINRGVLNVEWADYGVSHAMAYEVDNGSLIVRDAQMNETLNFIDDILPEISYFEYIRLDNLEPNFDYLSNFVEERK